MNLKECFAGINTDNDRKEVMPKQKPLFCMFFIFRYKFLSDGTMLIHLKVFFLFMAFIDHVTEPILRQWSENLRKVEAERWFAITYKVNENCGKLGNFKKENGYENEMFIEIWKNEYG